MKEKSGAKDVNVVELINAIENRMQNVHTSSLDISFNELLDMKNNGELDIRPDFQRLFQWSVGSQSRFIESLLLEMPVPPIYVIEEDEGKYLLIDGLQRISSYLHLRGSLNALHLDPPIKLGDRLKLTECDIVEELNGKTFDDLGTALQIRLKRAFIRVEVIRKGSDKKFRYHMFKRLNTGGEALSAQQVRNCTIRLLNSKFIDYIQDLSKDVYFLECIEILPQAMRNAGYDQELVLRFFALKNYREKFSHEVGDFLTEYLEKVSDPDEPYQFNYEEEKRIFVATFHVLSSTLQELAFGLPNRKSSAIKRSFGILQYEAITVGLQICIKDLDPNNATQMKRLKAQLNTIKTNPEFAELTIGAGKNSRGLLSKRIGFVESKLKGFQ